MTSPTQQPSAPQGDELTRYLAASSALQSSAAQVEQLEHSESVESFNRQLELLKRRLIAQPRDFRQMFISDGMAAVAWEFRQDELSEQFTQTLWSVLVRDNDASVVMMRFLWNLPLGVPQGRRL